MVVDVHRYKGWNMRSEITVDRETCVNSDFYVSVPLFESCLFVELAIARIPQLTMTYILYVGQKTFIKFMIS